VSVSECERVHVSVQGCLWGEERRGEEREGEGERGEREEREERESRTTENIPVQVFSEEYLWLLQELLQIF